MRLHYSQHATATYQALLALEASLKLDNPLKDLIKIRVSQINGCVFCVDMHVKEAKLHGERELRLYHLPVWRESALFSEKERAALQWAETLTRLADHPVSDADYAAVCTHFDEEELVASEFGEVCALPLHQPQSDVATTDGGGQKPIPPQGAGQGL